MADLPSRFISYHRDWERLELHFLSYFGGPHRWDQVLYTQSQHTGGPGFPLSLLAYVSGDRSKATYGHSWAWYRTVSRSIKPEDGQWVSWCNASLSVANCFPWLWAAPELYQILPSSSKLQQSQFCLWKIAILLFWGNIHLSSPHSLESTPVRVLLPPPTGANFTRLVRDQWYKN